MKKLTKKLSFDRQTIRHLMNVDLSAAQGGAPNPTRSGCQTECVPRTSDCGGTGHPTVGSGCL